MKTFLIRPVVRWLILGLSFCWTPSLLLMAQVATPSLDPTQSVLMPAAAAWRETPAVGIGYYEGSGTRTLEGQQIYQFDTVGLEAALTILSGNFCLDGYYEQSQTTVGIDQFYEGSLNTGRNDARLNIALTGNDFVTIGLGGRSTESKDYLDASGDVEKTTEIRTIGSISIKTLDIFYLGLGFERVKEESSYAVGINWNNMIGGIGMRIGEPSATRLRLEYAIALSEESKNEIRGELAANTHPKTTVTIASAELMFSGLLFSFSGEETVLDGGVQSPQNGMVVKRSKRTRNQGGVLWIPQQGLSLGFYFINQTRRESFADEDGLFRVNVGYLF
jgi:hypothetical protein